jgi:hypothetical protein
MSGSALAYEQQGGCAAEKSLHRICTTDECQQPAGQLAGQQQD